MKIAKIKVGQLIAWVIYLLMFALVLMEPNQLMSITEVNDGPGAAVNVRGIFFLLGVPVGRSGFTFQVLA